MGTVKVCLEIAYDVFDIYTYTYIIISFDIVYFIQLLGIPLKIKAIYYVTVKIYTVSRIYISSRCE